jgi:hypothetical protein
LAVIVKLPQRRAVACIWRHDYLDTFDILVRYVDGRIVRVAGDFLTEAEAVEVGTEIAIANHWDIERRSVEGAA